MKLRRKILKAIAKILKVSRFYRDHFENPTDFNFDEGKVYVWRIDGDGADAQEWAQSLRQKFIEVNGRPPDGMHLVIQSDVELVEDISAKEFKNKLKPWLKSQLKEQ